MLDRTIVAHRDSEGTLLGSRTVERKIRDVPPSLHDDKGHDHWPDWEHCILLDEFLVPVRPNGRGWWWGEQWEALRHDSWMYTLRYEHEAIGNA